MQNKQKILLGDADPLYLFYKKKSADDKMYRNMDTGEMSADRENSSAKDQWLVYSIDVPVEEN